MTPPTFAEYRCAVEEYEDREDALPASQTVQTSDTVRQYNVHGMRLRVESHARQLTEAVESVIRPFAVNRLERADFTVSIGYDPDPRGQDREPLRVMWRGIGPTGLDTAVRDSESVLVFELVGLAVVRIELSRRRAAVTVKPGEESCLNHGCITPMLCEFLHHVGHHVVHAAGLAAAAPDGDRAVLLAGTSGAGKTTAALALVQAGMRLMSDDACFVDARDLKENQTLKVWGLPRPCKVPRQTLELLPWLGELPHTAAVTEGEVLLELTRLPGVEPKREAAPGLILLLGSRNDREHILSPMDKLDMIAELARQNVRSHGPAGVSRARASFAALANLVAQSDCYGLSVGPDLGGLNDRLVERMGV